MRTELLLWPLALVGTIALLGVGSYGLYNLWNNTSQSDHATFVVEAGLVEEIVAVSGVIRSNTTARLGAQASGIITSLPIVENSPVTAGTVLARIDSTQLDIEIAEARAARAEAQAVRAELLAGPSTESRQVIAMNVAIAADQLERTKAIQTQAIENARRAYLSTAMVALADNQNERAPAPIVSGTYTCNDTGIYQLELYRSQSVSGFSVRVSGLESETQTVSFTQSIPLGSCGLRLNFTASDFYNNSRWTIPIPNTNAPQYTTTKNAYEAAKLQAQTAIAAAEDALSLAKQQESRDTASPRLEQIAQVDARIAALNARIDRLEQRRDDYVIRAPFAGIVTEISSVVGESVRNQTFITLLGNTDQFELRARIPEIDIAKLSPGQKVRARFDARRTETLSGVITSLSDLPVQVDGVAYFEARITLTEQPEWIRTGLNADIDIVTTEEVATLRIPTSFIQEQNGEFVADRMQGDRRETTPITVLLRGTNGYSAVSGLNSGDIIAAP